MQTKEKEIAKYLLETKAVFLNPKEPFTWASGIKSPIYCDNRILLSFADIRSKVIEAFVEMINKNYPQVDCIAGVATAGIAHAALIADRMNLPMIYIRSSAKDHGRSKQIEGKLNPGAKIVVIEDLISTGSSSIQAMSALDDEDAQILGLAAIFTYGLDKATKNLEKAKVKAVTLSNYEALIEVALKENYIEEADMKALIDWKKDLVST
jgi:orotate phosphoribosyltransferase